MRASFVRHTLAALGAQFAEMAGGLVAAAIPGESPAAPVVLRDLSPLPRAGWKGADTPAWLEARGFAFGPHNNATIQADGTLLARLSPGEFLLLAPLTGSLAAPEWNWDAGMCFPVPRQDSHCWFHLTGPDVPRLFAKICGIDLRPHKFPDLAIAQTSVARLNAILVRQGDAFHVLADSASAAYLWDCLTDAMEEFGGSVAGIASLGAEVSSSRP